MKSPSRFILAGAALLAATCPLTASAQQRPAAGSARSEAATAPLPHKVGLVDVGFIFTNYEKLKARREAFQAEVETSSAELKPIQDDIQTITKELQSGTITKGSDAWTERERRITELNAQGQAAASNLRRELAREEAQMYKDIYDEVAQTIAMYAKAPGRNYTLILRYQRDEEATGSAEDASRIMSRVNQLVVFHQDADDITDTILGFLNKQYEQQAAAARPAAPGRN